MTLDQMIEALIQAKARGADGDAKLMISVDVRDHDPEVDYVNDPEYDVKTYGIRGDAVYIEVKL